MRQKARSKWECLDCMNEAGFEDAEGWQDGPMKTWCPTPQETGNTPEYFAANPNLPF